LNLSNDTTTKKKKGKVKCPKRYSFLSHLRPRHRFCIARFFVSVGRVNAIRLTSY
tara:strand:- start:1237 stop:1401 length:165 start_codon:yes stop_codon:yes gene_type:complete